MTTPLRPWTDHLAPGVSTVDLAAGRTLPGAWTAAWQADPTATVLSTLDGVRISADELAGRTELAAGRYAAAGLSPGDRLLMYAPSSIDMIIAYVGALRAGLTVVPANPAYSATELATLVTAARPALVVSESSAVFESTVDVSVPVAPVDLSTLPGPASTVELDRAGPDDTALIIYTSGTTGRPKGVPLTQANLLASCHAVRIAWRWTPDDDLALCLPLFHVHGLGVGLHGALTAGASATVLPAFDPAGVAEAVRRGSTLLFAVPTMYHRLAESAELPALSRLRLAVSGSAPLSAQLHEQVRAGSGLTVLERYGMTETVMLVSNPYDGERRPGTVGFPLPGVELRLVPRGDPTASPASSGGATAEIEVRGPNVIRGYLDNPGATAEAFTPDGWLRTGDLGEVDEAGYLRISGRAKELIITGGYNVYPREVEEILRAHPSIVDVAVVGAPSPRWGETVVAFVVYAGDPPPAVELDEWCAQRLVPYKRPRAWRGVEAIPRNALGKILRHQLTP